MFCIYESHINRRDPVFYIFDVVGNLSLNLKVELCYHSTDGSGGLSCCYFVYTAYARSVSNS